MAIFNPIFGASTGGGSGRVAELAQIILANLDVTSVNNAWAQASVDGVFGRVAALVGGVPNDPVMSPIQFMEPFINHPNALGAASESIALMQGFIASTNVMDLIINSQAAVDIILADDVSDQNIMLLDQSPRSTTNPIMTSNTTPYGQVNSGGGWGTPTVLWMAFDADAASMNTVYTNAGANGAYLEYAFPSENAMWMYKIWPVIACGNSDITIKVSQQMGTGASQINILSEKSINHSAPLNETIVIKSAGHSDRFRVTALSVPSGDRMYVLNMRISGIR